MELEIIRFIQSFSSTMNDRIFEVITMLGEEFFVVAICTWIYWCYDKAKGKYIAYSLFTAITVNNIVKDIFKLPRPIGQAGILSKRVETATGYSFPSGHTQTASTLWTSISILSGKVWVYVISILAVVLVAISRLYLGVHYPKDVLVGAILGIIIPFVSCYLFEKFRNELMIATITLIPLSLGLFFAESADFYKAYGLYIGFVIGIIIEKQVNFNIPKSLYKKIIRFLVGIVLLAIFKIGLKVILPENIIFDMARYCFISLFGIGIYPLIFKKLKF